MASNSKVVKLNIGGETFATSSITLLAGGETFFSSLLSGRHESERDENGAYFIDRSPKYFGPILHYLRTNTIDIPSGYKLSAMRMEAEYYGIQKIVDHIDFLESEKKQEDSQPKVFPYLGDVGCYVDDVDKNAFIFGEDDKLTLVTGDQAFTQALVVHNHHRVPTEWSSDQSHARSFAVFYEQHVKKGKFKMNSEGRGLILSLPGKSHSIRKHLATLSKDQKSICVTSFSCNEGSGVFMCSHDNPHHFHLYKLKIF